MSPTSYQTALPRDTVFLAAEGVPQRSKILARPPGFVKRAACWHFLNGLCETALLLLSFILYSAGVSAAKLLIVFGLALALIGVVWLAAPHSLPKLFSWFGRLPGDIHIRSENTSVFIPLTSMILVSVVVSLLLRLFR